MVETRTQLEYQEVSLDMRLEFLINASEEAANGEFIDITSVADDEFFILMSANRVL